MDIFKVNNLNFFLLIKTFKIVTVIKIIVPKVPLFIRHSKNRDVWVCFFTSFSAYLYLQDPFPIQSND